MSIDEPVGVCAIKSVYLDLSSRLDMGVRIFLDLFQDLTVLYF